MRTPTAIAGESRGRIRSLAAHETTTELRVGDDLATPLVVDGRPDLPAAAALARSVVRVIWLRLTRPPGGALRANVLAVCHRRPVALPVTLPSALGLIELGVPAFFIEGEAA